MSTFPRLNPRPRRSTAPPRSSGAGGSSTSSSPASSASRRALIFLVWNIGYEAPSALLEPLLPGLQGLLDGPWLFAGVLGALIIRKPGAALYTELVAAAVVLGAHRQPVGRVPHARGRARPGPRRRAGLPAVPLRRWRLPVAILAGAGAALAGGINDLLLWYAGADTTFVDRLPHQRRSISGAVIAGALSWLLARGLAGHGRARPVRLGPRSRARASSVSRPAAASRPAAVEARGWGWRHATRHAWAVRDASFRIEPGERVLLLGASGSGKSTLLHGLAGVLGGDDEGEQTGALLIDGVPAARARGRAGLVLQDPDSPGRSSPGSATTSRSAARTSASRATRSGRGCGRRSTRSGSTCRSTGRPRRCPAGRSSGSRSPGVLAMRPGLLLLDEPTANLDPAGVAEVRDAVDRAPRRAPARRSSSSSTGSTCGCRSSTARHRARATAGVDRRRHAGRRARRARARRSPRAGVWVPGIPPARPPRARAAPGAALLPADGARRSRACAGIPVGVRHRRSRCAPARRSRSPGPTARASRRSASRSPDCCRRQAGTRRRRARARAGGAGPATRSAGASRQLLTRIGTVFQDPEHQLLATTVRAELEVGPRALGLRRRRDRGARRRAARAAAARRRSPRANPYTLSGGEKRRLTVAAALATAPARAGARRADLRAGRRAPGPSSSRSSRGLRDDGAAIVAITHDLDVVEALHARALRARGGGA